MLNENLRSQLDHAASDQPFIPDPGLALQRAKGIRARRRRAGMGAVACLVVAAAVAVPIVTTSRGGSDTNQVVPVGPHPASRTPDRQVENGLAPVSLAGVTVRWLPEGMSWTHQLTAGPDNYSPLNIVTYFQNGESDSAIGTNPLVAVGR